MNSDYNLAQYLFLGGGGKMVVIQNDFVEQITDLREWLKTPWVVDNNNNADI